MMLKGSSSSNTAKEEPKEDTRDAVRYFLSPKQIDLDLVERINMPETIKAFFRRHPKIYASKYYDSDPSKYYDGEIDEPASEAEEDLEGREMNFLANFV